MKGLFFCDCLVAIGMCLRVIEVAAEEQSPRTTSTPLVAISGTDSHITKPSYECISTKEHWRHIWARHVDLPQVPGVTVDDLWKIMEDMIMEVDFDRCFVVAIFRGEQIQVRQITIDSVSETADAINIRFSELHYSIRVRNGEKLKPRKPERPYAFVVLPKSKKEILLEEKIWSKEDAARGRPPKWKEVARLKATRTLSTEQRRES